MYIFTRERERRERDRERERERERQTDRALILFSLVLFTVIYQKHVSFPRQYVSLVGFGYNFQALLIYMYFLIFRGSIVVVIVWYSPFDKNS
jgi:polyferredoxin